MTDRPEIPPLCKHEDHRNGMWRCDLKKGKEDFCDRTAPDKMNCPNYRRDY